MNLKENNVKQDENERNEDEKKISDREETSKLSPPPPPLPERAPGRENSVGPPVSRLSKSACDELHLLFPRMEGFHGFDMNSGKWEAKSEKEGGSIQ